MSGKAPRHESCWLAEGRQGLRPVLEAALWLKRMRHWLLRRGGGGRELGEHSDTPGLPRRPEQAGQKISKREGSGPRKREAQTLAALRLQ